MYDKLVFKSYGTRNLNEAAGKFQNQTGRMAEVFVVRSNWVVFGSKENKKKVLISRFGGYASISIPLRLSREEIKKLEVAQKKSASIEKVRDDEERNVMERLKAYTRYCNYCGRMYGTDPLNVVIHCSAPRCIQAHEDWLEHKAEIKRLQGSNSKSSGGSKKKETQEKLESLPKFDLDDPNNPSIRGWVYLIESENGLYKIGRSDNIETRFNELSSLSPVPLWLTHAVFANDYKRAEAWLHSQFHKHRHHGEWFSLAEDEVRWITELKDHALDRV